MKKHLCILFIFGFAAYAQRTVVGDLEVTGEISVGDAAATRTNLGVEIGTDVQGVLAEGAFVDGDKTKLDGIEAGATAGGGSWGDITGTLADQTDLQTELDDKVDLSPADGTTQTIEGGGLQLLEVKGVSGTYRATRTSGAGEALITYLDEEDLIPWQTGIKSPPAEPEANAYIIYCNRASDKFIGLWISLVDKYTRLIGLVTNVVQASTTGGIALKDSSGTTLLTIGQTGQEAVQVTGDLDVSGSIAGYVIGTDVQAWDADLDTLAGNDGSNLTGVDAETLDGIDSTGFVQVEKVRLTVGFFGAPLADDLDWLLIARAIEVKSASPGVAYARTAATASTTFDVQKNGVSIGSVVFAAAGTVGTVTITADTSFAAGDRLELVAPSTADDTCAHIQLVLIGEVQ